MNPRAVPLVVMLIQGVALVMVASAAGANPALLPLCGAAYVLGLRHALDADHIAAIDNVSRSLVGRGERATAVGMFFALGHSAAVTLASVAVTAVTIRTSPDFDQARSLAAVYSTLISVAVLATVAPRNVLAAWRIHRTGVAKIPTTARYMLPTGFAGRLIRPLLRLRIRDWQMVFVGALFGLGFETATAIAVLGLSATQVSGGMSASTAMIFPLLFTAGMTLVDALDGIFMERAYGWALRDPARHARYYLFVTALSALVAALVVVYEIASVVDHVSRVPLRGTIALEFIESHFEEIGAAIAGVFAVVWLVAAMKSRRSKLCRKCVSVIAVKELMSP